MFNVVFVSAITVSLYDQLPLSCGKHLIL